MEDETTEESAESDRVEEDVLSEEAEEDEDEGDEQEEEEEEDDDEEEEEEDQLTQESDAESGEVEAEVLSEEAEEDDEEDDGQLQEEEEVDNVEDARAGSIDSAPKVTVREATSAARCAAAHASTSAKLAAAAALHARAAAVAATRPDEESEVDDDTPEEESEWDDEESEWDDEESEWDDEESEWDETTSIEANAAMVPRNLTSSFADESTTLPSSSEAVGDELFITRRQLTSIFLDLDSASLLKHVRIVCNKTQKHSLFLDRALPWQQGFKRGNLLLSSCLLLAIGLCVADLTSSALGYRGTPFVLVMSASCLIISAIGWAGATRLRDDVKYDTAAGDSLARRLIELYFWLMTCALIVLVGGTVVILIDSYRKSRHLKEEASRFPDDFRSDAESRRLDASPGTNSVDSVAQYTWIVDCTVAAACLVASAACLVLLRAAKQMLTTFEIMESALHWMALIYALIGLTLMYLGSVGVGVLTELDAVQPLPTAFAWLLISLLASQMLIGSMMVLVGLVGAVAKRHNNRCKLHIYAFLTKVNLVLLSLDTVVAIAIAAGALDILLDHNCKELLEVGSADWFQSLHGRLLIGSGCQKYYGRSFSRGDDGVLLADSKPVGPWVVCNDPSEAVYAWESNHAAGGACGEISLYGCLNMRCCSVVKELLQLIGTVLAVVALAGSLALLTGAAAARYAVRCHLAQLKAGNAGNATPVAAKRLIGEQRQERMKTHARHIVSDIESTYAASPPPSPPPPRLPRALQTEPERAREALVRRATRDAFKTIVNTGMIGNRVQLTKVLMMMTRPLPDTPQDTLVVLTEYVLTLHIQREVGVKQLGLANSKHKSRRRRASQKSRRTRKSWKEVKPFEAAAHERQRASTLSLLSSVVLCVLVAASTAVGLTLYSMETDVASVEGQPEVLGVCAPPASNFTPPLHTLAPPSRPPLPARPLPTINSDELPDLHGDMASGSSFEASGRGFTSRRMNVGAPDEGSGSGDLYGDTGSGDASSGSGLALSAPSLTSAPLVSSEVLMTSTPRVDETLWLTQSNFGSRCVTTSLGSLVTMSTAPEGVLPTDSPQASLRIRIHEGSLIPPATIDSLSCAWTLDVPLTQFNCSGSVHAILDAYKGLTFAICPECYGRRHLISSSLTVEETALTEVEQNVAILPLLQYRREFRGRVREQMSSSMTQASTINASVRLEYTLGDEHASCTESFTTPVEPDGSYSFQSAVPAVRHPSVSLTLLIKSSSGVASQVALPTAGLYDDGHLPVTWVDTVHLIPSTDLAYQVPMTGCVVAKLLVYNADGSLDVQDYHVTAGMLTISLHGTMAVSGAYMGLAQETAPVQRGGEFNFTSARWPGMHMISVGLSDTSAMRILTESQSVRHDDDQVKVFIILFRSAAHELPSKASGDRQRLVAFLSWQHTALSLSAAFNVTQSSSRCDVWQGRPVCGGAYWYGSSQSPVEAIALTAHEGQYSFYSSLVERRCDGYGMPSSPNIPGGSSSPIDCVGDCTLGTGFCYSTSDGQACGRCSLWDVGDPEGVVCSDVARAQGGPLPCSPFAPPPSSSRNQSMANPRRDSAENSKARLTLVVDNEIALAAELASLTAGSSDDAVDGAFLACILAGASDSLRIHDAAPKRMSLAELVGARVDPQSCAETGQVATWACQWNAWPPMCSTTTTT